MITPAVVNFHAVKTHWDKQERVWDDNKFLYIGRYNLTYHLTASKWANPYKVGEGGLVRGGTIELYRSYINKLIAEGQVDLAVLDGKTLVCWCKPLACHGDVLIQLFNARYSTGIDNTKVLN